MDPRPATRIVDLDGLVFQHAGSMRQIVNSLRQEAVLFGCDVRLLPGVIEAFTTWERSGDHIIILTGRPECLRAETDRQLKSNGLFYNQLIMGVGGGTRHLYNDQKPDGSDTAFAYNIPRNTGLEGH